MPATQSALSAPRRSRARARALMALAPLALLAAGGALLGARARVPDNEIAPGVHIGALDLGGKSLDAARTALEQWADARQKTPVTLRFAPETGITRVWQTSAQYLGLGIDVPATLDAASKAGRSGLVSQVSTLVQGPHTVLVPPTPAVDTNRLRPVLKQVGITVLRKPVNARLILLKDGGFGTRHEQAGQAMDVDAAMQTVTQAWFAALGTTTSASAAPVAPPVTPPPTDINAHQKPDPATAGDAAAQDHPHSRTPEAHPTASVASPELPPLDVELSVHSTQPDITLADLKQIDGPLGSKSTTYATGDRGDNIHLAASRINGTLLKPGDVFSYNKIVGPRIARLGFKDAPVIINGELKPGIGGGICQVSSTLYNAALLSGLKIVQRSHHAFPVHYLPAGRDATVVDGDIDFQFQNSTEAPIYILARGRGGLLSFSIYGKTAPGREIVMEKGRDIIGSYATQIENDPTKRAGYREVKRRGFPDRRVTWYRVVRENGKEVSREAIKTHYSAIDEIITVGTGAAAPRRRAPHRTAQPPVSAPVVTPPTSPQPAPGAGQR